MSIKYIKDIFLRDIKMASEVNNNTNVQNNQNIFTYGSHAPRHDNSNDNSKKKNIEQVTSDFFGQLVENVADYFVKEGQTDSTPQVEEAAEAFFEQLSFFVAEYFKNNSLDGLGEKVETKSFFENVSSFITNYFNDNFGERSRQLYKSTAINFAKSLVPDITGYLEQIDPVLTGETAQRTLDLNIHSYNFAQAMRNVDKRNTSKKVDGIA